MFFFILITNTWILRPLILKLNMLLEPTTLDVETKEPRLQRNNT